MRIRAFDGRQGGVSGSQRKRDWISARALVAAASLALLAANTAWAGKITSFDGASGPGLQSMSFNTLIDGTDNNDNVVGASDNEIRVNQKAYDVSDYIDMEFSVADRGGVSEYLFTEGLGNNTPDTWTGYRIELGFGVGAGFVASASGDGLDFDSPDFDSPAGISPAVFSTFSLTEDVITLSDGSIGPLGFADLAFSLDIPDGITSFTLRQIPIVPEPSTGLLVFCGLIGLSRRAVRRS